MLVNAPLGIAQVGEPTASEIERMLPARGDGLVDQILAVGPTQLNPRGGFGTFVKLADGRYVLSRPDGSAIIADNVRDVIVVEGGRGARSLDITLIDPDGNETRLHVTSAVVKDRNRVDVNARLLDDEGRIQRYLSGSFTGQPGLSGVLSLRVSDPQHEGVSRLFAVDYSGMDIRSGMPFSDAVKVEEFGNNIQSPLSGSREPVEVAAAAAIIGGVLVIVIIGCFLDWWCQGIDTKFITVHAKERVAVGRVVVPVVA
ncbi:MAG: hypothetical protein ACE5HE_05930 [Phycisphaerae bacterium]